MFQLSLVLIGSMLEVSMEHVGTMFFLFVTVVIAATSARWAYFKGKDWYWYFISKIRQMVELVLVFYWCTKFYHAQPVH